MTLKRGRLIILTKIFKSKTKLLYFTQNSPIHQIGNYDLILSPMFYWVKKVELPVKKLSAAKKLAESIYEGSLPEGDFAYDVSKVGDEFIIIAYDKETISKEISKKFIKNAKVNSVYFAQNEFSDLKACCGIDKVNSLVNLDGLIMQVPRLCTESKKEVGAYLKDKKLSNKRISLGSLESSVISSKEVYMLAAGVAFLFSSFVLDWFNYSSATTLLDERRSEIVSKYKLPQTSIQLNSIKKTLTKTFNVQKKIRDEVFVFNSISLKKGEFIESINANTKETVVIIKVESSSREEHIKSQISKMVKVKSSEFSDGHLTIRVAS